ncbi:MAG: PEP-CTERM sorting domain-containing protein [Magnetospiraceae bacterium]
MTNGEVREVARGDLVSPTYLDTTNNNIRLDFSSAVSAIGLDFNSNNVNVTLFVFDALDNLLESLTIPTAEQFSCGSFLCGFVGIDVGSNLISYATVDTPMANTSIFIDNIIYQQVPEPATLALFGLGLAGMGVAARRRQKTA